MVSEDCNCREIEIKYKNLFERAPIGIFTSNSQGALLSVNQYMAEMLGCKDVNDALNTYQDLGSDLYEKSSRREQFLQEIKKSDEVKDFELGANLINGDHIWLNLNARISKKFADGSFIIEGFAFDITERKRYEKQVQKRKEELLDYNQELTAYSQEVTAMNEELADSMKKINELNERFVNMIDLVSKLYGDIDNNDKSFMSDLLKTAINIVPEADYGTICLFDKEDNCKFIDVIGHDIELLKITEINKNILFHISDKGTYVSDTYSLNIDKLPQGQKKIFEKALKPIDKSMYINIKIGSEIVGRIILDIARDSNKDFSTTTKLLLKSFANLGSAFFSFQKYNEIQGQFTRELILSIIRILDMYDKYTSGHSHNVAQLGAAIAEEMGLSEEETKDTYWAGMVHDLGKLLVPLDILNKKGNLTDEEYAIIKKHPHWSYSALKDSKSLRRIAKYVLYHHERWDGSGYPQGLSGNKIPLISQILGVADAWDAMTSNRSYRALLSDDEALQEIIANKGTQFSPEVVEVFLQYLSDI